MSAQIANAKFDYIFAGAGAAASLLLLRMEQRGLLDGKKIVVIDPDTKSKNDKTFCFWSTSEELKALQCGHLISHEWANVRMTKNKPESLETMKYSLISSLDVYSELKRILKKYGIERQHSEVKAIHSTGNGLNVETENGVLNATVVFDSRPPLFLPSKKNEVHLLQSFLGYVIEIETPLSDPDCIDLMDFEVNQLEYTQFVYVLPFGPTKLLVELTRFGEVAITSAEAEPILMEYITRRFGKFKRTDIETGCIPMSSAAISKENLSGVVSIGSRAGAVKPSTGYAFKNMLRHAEKITESLVEGKKLETIKRPSRFVFYDRLLLLILSRKPQMGKLIFQTLFQKNKMATVFQFLDEKSTLKQELFILYSLPIIPFLQAWRYDITIRFKNTVAPFLLLLVTFLLWVLSIQTPNSFDLAQQIVFSVGLLIVGIPHGSVDHLLEAGKLDSRPKIGFLLRYLGAAAGFLLFWLVFPTTALLLFLIYSAWHFGQGDLQQWQLQKNKIVKSWLWGCLLFAIILFGHVTETNFILFNMQVKQIDLSNETGKMVSYVLVLLALIWGILERRPAIILCVLMLALGIQLPLLTAFGLYFIGQHSINGWTHLKQGLKTNNKSLFRNTIPFTAGAVFLFAGLVYSLEKGWLEAFNGHWITAFFVFISCLSLPHVLTMHRFYKKHF